MNTGNPSLSAEERARENARLLDAARTGKPLLMARALAAGADINTRDDNGNTALIWAAELNHLSTLAALLEAGADLTPQNKFGQNALLRGLRERADRKIALALLEAGCPCHGVDVHKRSAASYAAEQGLADVFDKLMDNAADLTLADKNGWTPLHHAVFSGHLPILLRAIQSPAGNRAPALDQPESEGRSPLLLAARSGQGEAAAALIKAGANIDLRDNNGESLEDFANAAGLAALLPLIAQRRADNLGVIHRGVAGSAMKPVRFRPSPSKPS